MKKEKDDGPMTPGKLEKLRSQWKPRDRSGKTKYNRLKKPGESWTKLRDEARERRKAGRGAEAEPAAA